MSDPSEASSEAPPPPPAPVRTSRSRRITSIAFLVVGLVVASYLGVWSPQEQHVRIVLGSQAPEVADLGLRYVASDGESAREVHFAYGLGKAPRIVSHEPKLPNGDYRLDIEVDVRDGGRRALQRQVRLGGGSTQVDISSALSETPGR